MPKKHELEGRIAKLVVALEQARDLIEAALDNELEDEETYEE